MKTISFYHKNTGLLHPMVLTVSTGQDVSTKTPIDHIPIEGHYDPTCMRVDLQTKTVIDYIPPQPSSDHQWNRNTKRWALDATLIIRRQAALSATATSLTEREAAVLVREQEADRREASAIATAKHRDLIETQLREANEHLTVAAVRSQTLSVRRQLDLSADDK
jgi:hypothetical protein